MLAGLILKRILIDGAVLTAIAAPLLVLTLALNPRLALSDYPADVQAAVPARTRAEVWQAILLSLPFFLAAIAVPLYSTWLLKQENGGVITYWMAFATILGVHFVFWLFDLLVLDIWMFCTWTPSFVVIPGTEGMAGYKDWRAQVRAHMTTGLPVLVVAAALLALIPAFLY
jgi:Na+-transporting methylmalonyl-CoA/oxaloacetate decarboxylase gamma subunit